MAKQITAQEAAALLHDNMTVAIGGFGAYCGPDELLQAVADRYAGTGHPCGLVSVTGVSPGNFRRGKEGAGLSRLRAEGLLGTVIAGHLGNTPDIAELVGENKVAGYLIPLGVMMHLFRAIAGKKLGVVTQVGLGTHADPRDEGCKANEKAVLQNREIVQLLQLEEKEYLFYPSFPIDVCLIRGTYADRNGNISMAHESLDEAQLQMAAAVHNSGGIVIAQVETIVEERSLPARSVRIPRTMVDYYVKAKPEYQKQYYAADNYYHGEMTGEIYCPAEAIDILPLNTRKVIARRAAKELKRNCLVNLGIGLPSGVGNVANEEGVAQEMTLSLESGVFGGVPLPGDGFGGAINPEVILSSTDTFDLYDGGILDMTFLGAAEVDQYGNVNVSRFGTRCTGPGGFINISQNTSKVIFMLNFTSGQSDIACGEGELIVRRDGEKVKFVKEVQQITFSGDYARKTKQNVIYITERAVFQLTEKGLMLVEIAPGISLQEDILDHMEFSPLIAEKLKIMDRRIFTEGKMGLDLQ